MIHNQLTYSVELQSGLARATGMSNEAEGVIRLGETLDPTIDPWSQPEWAFLRGERLGAGRTFQAAVPAESSIIALGNAAGSGNIVVVEAISINSGGASVALTLQVVLDTAVAATLSGQAFFASGRDRRWGSTAGRTFTRSGSDPGTTFGGVQLDEISTSAANQVIKFEIGLPAVLRPGDDLIVVNNTQNQQMTVSWKWRERKAFNGELPA